MDDKIRIELLKIFYNRHKVVNELGWKAIVDSGYDTIIEDIVKKFDLIPRVSKCCNDMCLNDVHKEGSVYCIECKYL